MLKKEKDLKHFNLPCANAILVAMKLYQQLLMDHYQHPRNKGHLKNPDFTTEDYNPSCGDSCAFEGIIKNNCLVDVAFTGKGCVISQATASLLTEWALGKTVTEIMTLDAEGVQQMIGMPLGPMRLRCALLPLQVLQAGIKELSERA